MGCECHSVIHLESFADPQLVLSLLWVPILYILTSVEDEDNRSIFVDLYFSSQLMLKIPGNLGISL